MNKNPKAKQPKREVVAGAFNPLDHGEQQVLMGASSFEQKKLNTLFGGDVKVTKEHPSRRPSSSPEK